MKALLVCAVVALLSFAGVAFAAAQVVQPEAVKAAPVTVELSKAAADAVKAALPNAVVAKAKLIEKEGVKLYTVVLTEGEKPDRKIYTVTVSDTGVVTTITAPIAPSDLPKPVADAVPAGATVKSATKTEQCADAKLTKIDPPKVTYELGLAQGEEVGRMVVAADGTVVKPAMMMKIVPKSASTEAPAAPQDKPK